MLFSLFGALFRFFPRAPFRGGAARQSEKKDCFSAPICYTVLNCLSFFQRTERKSLS